MSLVNILPGRIHGFGVARVLQAHVQVTARRGVGTQFRDPRCVLRLLAREIGCDEVAGHREEHVEGFLRFVLGAGILEGHLPFLALLLSTCSIALCCSASRGRVDLPDLTSASLRCLAQPSTTLSAAGLEPWKWQLPPSLARAGGAAPNRAISEAVAMRFFI